jgi:two-component system, LytTR family, sensor kinase
MSTPLHTQTGSLSQQGIFYRYRILWHILFWVWLYSLDVFIFGVGYDNISLFLKFALLEMPGQLLFAYAVAYWILPRHFRNQQYGATFAWTFVVFFLTGVVGHWLFMGTGSYSVETTTWDLPKIFLRAFYSFLKALIFIVIKLVRMWYENQKAVTEMDKSRLESELKMLKGQVNPHFMFNTLNNLYGLIGKNPLHAQESVLGLSGILRYMLYDSNQKTVPLQREIKCIESYIQLEKLRYPGNLSVSVNIQDEVRGLSIVPLCLFPFVENSFKHGASEIISDAWINIDLSVYKNDFIFKIENSKGHAIISRNGNGIGLSNVKRRLELLYKSDHRLQIVEAKEHYLVVLKIALKEMKKQNVEAYEGEMSYRGR